jgi:hypothetical protein
MEFAGLFTVGGADKLLQAPAIEEIGGGWYKFSAAYGTAPFDEGDLAGVIDADKDGSNGLCDMERYIPVEVRLDYYAMWRMVGPMSQDKVNGQMRLYDSAGEVILRLSIEDGQETVMREPGIEE